VQHPLHEKLLEAFRQSVSLRIRRIVEKGDLRALQHAGERHRVPLDRATRTTRSR